MRRSLLALITILATLTTSASAEAARTLTPARSIAIAERWIAQTYPALPNPCAGGKLKLTFVENPVVDGLGVRGFARGWVGDRWEPTLCDAVIRAGMPAGRTCTVIAHEALHFVLGPEHVGALAPTTPEGTGCYDWQTVREKLIASIRHELPAGAWTVRCTRSAPKMRCRAISPRARYARVFAAGIHRDGGYGYDRGRLARRLGT